MNNLCSIQAIIKFYTFRFQIKYILFSGFIESDEMYRSFVKRTKVYENAKGSCLVFQN